MIDKNKELKKLYRDATYYHLLNQGFTKTEANVWARRLWN